MIVMLLRFLPFLLIGIMIPSFVEVDITLPGFPQMAEYFHSSEAEIQRTLVINFVGLCAFTLIYGPLSDSFGRKKIIILGCFLFLMGSIGCVFSNQLLLLYVSRFLQGLGCSAVWVVGFIVCADSYKGDKAIQIFGILSSAISTSLILAPIIGTFIVAMYGWRETFSFVAFLSFFAFLVAVFLLPETNLLRKPFSIKTVLSDYYQLSSSMRFLIYALTPSIFVSAFIVYVSAVPFFYLGQLKMSFQTFALYQAIPGFCLAVVAFYSGKINQKIGASKCILLSVIICFMGCAFFLITSRIRPNSAEYFTLSMALICVGSSLQFSIIFSKSLEIFPKLHGAASSLITFFRLILFTASILFASKYYTGKLYDTAQIIISITLIGVVFSMIIRYDMERIKSFFYQRR